MTRADRLREARDLFVAHEWSDARTHFECVDGEEPLGGDDLARLAVAQYLVGRELESVDTWTRAFHVAREQDDLARAARCGFWVGFVLLNRGDVPGGNGWIARVRRVLADVDAGVVEAGYVRYLDALRTIFEGDDETARAGFEEAAQVGVASVTGTSRRWRGLVRVGHSSGSVALRTASRASTRRSWRSLPARSLRWSWETATAPRSRAARSCSTFTGRNAGPRS